MLGPKVKLPSIAELTQTTLPRPQAKTSPLQTLVPGLEQPTPESRKDSNIVPPSTPGGLPLFQYYSYNGAGHPAPFYLHSYYQPVYYLPPMVNRSFSAPENKPVYSVPEVINKSINKCHRCGTTETPECRSGPNGLRTLCNACGLFHAKLVKRKGAAIAAEEVLNNKVCKGKNGRRVSVKKQAMEESKKRMREAQVTELAPIPYVGAASDPVSGHAPVASAPPAPDYVYHTRPEVSGLPIFSRYPRVSLPPPVINAPFQPLAGLRN